MIRIAACDGSEHVRSCLLVWIKEWMVAAGIEADVFGVTDSEGLEYECEEYGGADLVFAETEPEDGTDDNERFMKLKKSYPAMDIVIVTKRGRPYRSLFELWPFYCLEKPVDKKELYSILRIYTEKKINEKFWFRFKKVYYAIPVDQIIHIDRDIRKIEIYCTEGRRFLTYMKMEEAEKRIDSSNRTFLRIRDSCMINIKRLKKISAGYVQMDNGEVLDVSRMYASGVMVRVSEYYIAVTAGRKKSHDR